MQYIYIYIFECKIFIFMYYKYHFILYILKYFCFVLKMFFYINPFISEQHIKHCINGLYVGKKNLKPYLKFAF